MSRHTKITASIAAAQLALLGTLSLGAGPAAPQGVPADAPRANGDGIPALPPTPAAAGDLLFAQAFEVERGWASDFRADHPRIERGFIVVLRADAGLAFPRQVACPVLMAGTMPCEVVDPVQGSEVVLAIVPVLDSVDGAGRADLTAETLAAVALYWAEPALPEQVTAASAHAAHQAAERAGVATSWTIAGAQDPEARAGKAKSILAAPVAVKDREALVAVAAAARAAVLAK